MAKAWRYFLPLAIFFGLVWFLWRGLSLNPRDLPSVLINKPVPAFRLTKVHAPEQTFAAADMRGKVWLLNVWASWCVSCRAEHPVLKDLARQQVVPIVGLNWKDKGDDARAWLVKYGDPYELSVSDIEGRTAIDLGVTGAPETFVIDKAGVIRYKHTGPVGPEDVEKTLVPIIRELQKA
jgi:cytochrome c biogenesis protein CcmG/thiol:disulfide interchange protein DsbE